MTNNIFGGQSTRALFAHYVYEELRKREFVSLVDVLCIYYKRDKSYYDLHTYSSDKAYIQLKKAFPEVNKRSIRGFFTNDALLVGVESRTSSPVRVPRDPETYESDAIPGLLPCGEGAGYSGGIVSSAIDGINCAVAASRSLSSPVPEPAEGPVVRQADQPEK